MAPRSINPAPAGPATIPTVALKDRKAQAAVRAARELDAQIKELTAQRDAHVAVIKAAMGDNEIATVGGREVCTFRLTMVTSIDQTKLKQEHPEIAQKCQVNRPRRSFKLVAPDGAV